MAIVINELEIIAAPAAPVKPATTARPDRPASPAPADIRRTMQRNVQRQLRVLAD